MKRYTTSLLAAVLALSLFSCTKRMEIAVVVTTDVHGNILPLNGEDAEKSAPTLAMIPSLVKELELSGYKVILLDNGDILQGSASVYRSNFVDTGDYNIVARALNYLNYRAMTVGNHDIETGHPVYDKLERELNFPLLAANAVDVTSGEPYFDPYTLIDIDGCSIAVIGLVTPWIPNWLPPVLYEGMEFHGMVESAVRTMPEVLKHKPALTIGLFHSGWSEGEIPAAGMPEENGSSRVVREVEGFDLIFIGHDHRVFFDKVATPKGDSIYLLDGGSHARYAAVAKISLKKGFMTSWKVSAINPEIIDLAEFQPDSGYVDYFAADIAATNSYISRKLGSTTTDISTRDSWFGPSTLLTLIHTIQLEITKADVSFAAPLTFDAIIPAGDIIMEQLFTLYRYENYLYTMNLTGKEIDNFLEYSYSLWINTMSDKKSMLLNLSQTEEGEIRLSNGKARFSKPYYNFDSAQGIVYTVNVTADEGNRVEISGFSDGRAFSETSLYKVVMNSYRGNGGGGHMTEGLGFSQKDIVSRLVVSTDRDFRFYINEWIMEKGSITVKAAKNWSFVPADWVKEARMREEGLLYGTDNLTRSDN